MAAIGLLISTTVWCATRRESTGRAHCPRRVVDVLTGAAMLGEQLLLQRALIDEHGRLSILDDVPPWPVHRGYDGRDGGEHGSYHAETVVAPVDGAEATDLRTAIRIARADVSSSFVLTRLHATTAAMASAADVLEYLADDAGTVVAERLRGRGLVDKDNLARRAVGSGDGYRLRDTDHVALIVGRLAGALSRGEDMSIAEVLVAALLRAGFVHGRFLDTAEDGRRLDDLVRGRLSGSALDLVELTRALADRHLHSPI